MKSRAARILIGCGLGCGALVVVVVIAVVSFFVWLQRPGELLTPRMLLLPDAAGYAEWTLRYEDEGTAEFVEGLLASLDGARRQANQALPGPVGPLISDLQAGNDERAFRELFPMVGVWSVRPGGGVGGADAHVIGVSVESLGHRVRFTDWLLGRIFPDEQIVRHAGERIYAPRDMAGRAFFLHGSEVVVGSDVEATRAAAERFADGRPGEPRELTALLDATPERPLRLALLNRDGLVEALWLDLVGAPADPDAGPAWQDVGAVTASGGFEGPDLAMTIDVLFEREATATDADLLAGALRARLASVGDGADVAGRASGRRIRLDVRARDLLAMLDELLRRAPAAAG